MDARAYYDASTIQNYWLAWNIHFLIFLPYHFAGAGDNYRFLAALGMTKLV